MNTAARLSAKPPAEKARVPGNGHPVHNQARTILQGVRQRPSFPAADGPQQPPSPSIRSCMFSRGKTHQLLLPYRCQVAGLAFTSVGGGPSRSTAAVASAQTGAALRVDGRSPGSSLRHHAEVRLPLRRRPDQNNCFCGPSADCGLCVNQENFHLSGISRSVGWLAPVCGLMYSYNAR